MPAGTERARHDKKGQSDCSCLLRLSGGTCVLQCFEQFETRSKRGPGGEVAAIAVTRAATLGLVNDGAFLDGDHHTQLIQCFRIHLGRIFGKDDEIGQLAGLDRAFVIFLEMLSSGPYRHGLESRHHVDPLCGTENIAGPRAPRHRGIQDPHAVRKRHGRVVIGSKLHSPRRNPSRGRDVVAQGWPNRVITMSVTPVEDVHGKQGRKDPEAFQCIDLILAQQWAVDKDRTAVRLTAGSIMLVRWAAWCKERLLPPALPSEGRLPAKSALAVIPSTRAGEHTRHSRGNLAPMKPSHSVTC